MDKNEEFKQHEHQKFVESLSQSDAAELEQLGHHGIRGALNRDKEADVSFQHEFENSALYKMSHQNPTVQNPAVSKGWNANPFATLWLALSIILICGSFGLTCLQKPIERQPAIVRPWPSVIAHVVNTVVHNGRHEEYDYTFDYKVGNAHYRFTEDRVGTLFDMSEVKYDPKAPTHYFRVPLDAEGIMPLIVAGLGLIVGLSFAWDAIAKCREGSKGDLGPTLAFLLLAASLTMLPIAFYISSSNQITPYSIATELR